MIAERRPTVRAHEKLQESTIESSEWVKEGFVLKISGNSGFS